MVKIGDIINIKNTNDRTLQGIVKSLKETEFEVVNVLQTENSNLFWLKDIAYSIDMNKTKYINYNEIAERTYFDLKYISKIVDILQSLVDNLFTTDDIVRYWEENCFRASDIEEVLEQFEIDTKIEEIGHRVFMLDEKMLVVIGIGTSYNMKYDKGYAYLEKLAKDNDMKYYEIVEDNYKYENGMTLINYADKEKEQEIEIIEINLDNLEDYI